MTSRSEQSLSMQNQAPSAVWPSPSYPFPTPRRRNSDTSISQPDHDSPVSTIPLLVLPSAEQVANLNNRTARPANLGRDRRHSIAGPTRILPPLQRAQSARQQLGPRKTRSLESLRSSRAGSGRRNSVLVAPALIPAPHPSRPNFRRLDTIDSVASHGATSTIIDADDDVPSSAPETPPCEARKKSWATGMGMGTGMGMWMGSKKGKKEGHSRRTVWTGVGEVRNDVSGDVKAEDEVGRDDRREARCIVM